MERKKPPKTNKKAAKYRGKTVKVRDKLIANAGRRHNQRRMKPPSNKDLQNLDDFDDGSKSDLCIEYPNGTSYSTDDTADQTDDENAIGCNDNLVADGASVVTVDQDNLKKENLQEIVDEIHICSICLGDVSNDANAIIHCYECGVSVHEGCYLLNGSGSSSVSSLFKNPWFCDTCTAFVQNPTCEFCPNLGGIFKETECGKWVHLVCAFYICDLPLGEPITLSSVQLFEKVSSQSGGKSCDLCKDTKLMCTGLTIPCAAEKCEINFHVTCAQQEGSLSIARNQVIEDQELNFHKYIHGHCKLHVDDKLIAQKRKEIWEVLQIRTKQMKLLREQHSSEKTATWQRNQPGLEQLRSYYYEKKKENSKPESTFKSKVPRSITTSASTCQASQSNTTPDKLIEDNSHLLKDLNYFAKLISAKEDLKKEIENFTDIQNKLREEYMIALEGYNQESSIYEKAKQKLSKLKNATLAHHNFIRTINPNAKLPDHDTILTKNWHQDKDFGNDVSVGSNNKCEIRDRSNDQHFKPELLGCKCDKSNSELESVGPVGLSLQEQNTSSGVSSKQNHNDNNSLDSKPKRKKEKRTEKSPKPGIKIKPVQSASDVKGTSSQLLTPSSGNEIPRKNQNPRIDMKRKSQKYSRSCSLSETKKK